MDLSDQLTSPRSPAAATTIGQLVGAIGPPVLRVLLAPRGLEIPVRTTSLHDPIDPLPANHNALLLMTGLRADDPAAATLLREAAKGGYSCVVIKCRRADTEALLFEAGRLGVCVLAAADEVAWRHVDALLLSVLGSRGIDGERSAGPGEELFALANATAAAVGGSVAIEDLDRRVLAYSSLPQQPIDAVRRQGILDRKVPSMARHLSQYASVLAASGVVRFTAADVGMPRAAITVRAGNQPLGTIWAIENPDCFDSVGERALVDAARLSALHLLRNRSVSEIDIQLRESALRSALDGLLTTDEVAFRLSLSRGSEINLIGFAVRSEAQNLPALIAQLGGALSRHFAAFRPDAAVATTARAVYIVIPAASMATAARLASAAITTIAASFPDQLRAAVAASTTKPDQLPAMRREVDDVLRITSEQPTLPDVATMADVHARVLFAHIGDELTREPRLRHAGVDAMIIYDRERRTEYAASMKAWLDCVGDIAEAAQGLGVHPNTLRYRLRRAAQLFNVAVDDADDRLALWLHLRIANSHVDPV